MSGTGRTVRRGIGAVIVLAVLGPFAPGGPLAARQVDSVLAPPGEKDVTFTGCVVKVKRSPGVWSGALTVYQAVRYEIVDVLAGQYQKDQITVQHLIVHGKGDVRNNSPRLKGSVRSGKGVKVRSEFDRSPALGTIYAASTRVRPRPGLDCPA